MSSIQIVISETTTVENFQDEVLAGRVTFYTVRSNETTRRVNLPLEGTTERETAEWVQEQRDNGVTMKAIAAEMHLSVPSVRRILNGLLLAEEVEGYEAEDIAEIVADAQADQPVALEVTTENGIRPADTTLIGPMKADGSF